MTIHECHTDSELCAILAKDELLAVTDVNAMIKQYRASNVHCTVT